MRFFIALEIPDEIKKKLVLIGSRFKKEGFDCKYSTAEKMHMTLLFIGECGEKEAVEKFNAFRKNRENKKFKISIESAGKFETRGVPKILFADIKKGRDELGEINRTLADKYKEILVKNSLINSFEPHITIGRVKSMDKEKIELFGKMVKEQEILLEFEAEKIVLYESILKNSGAEYREVEKIEIE